MICGNWFFYPKKFLIYPNYLLTKEAKIGTLNEYVNENHLTASQSGKKDLKWS